MRCREVSRLIASGELAGASLAVRAWAGLHLLICRHCRRYRRQVRLLGAAARAWAERLVDPAAARDFESRLIAALQRGRS